MELQKLHVASVAQFEQVGLDLGPGLHMLYGPNETGKSTLLALFIDLLFGGQPERREWYEGSSRLIAEILHQGKVYDLRRKRYRSQLIEVSADDKPSDADFTADLLRMDRHRFMQLYGFDHERLRTGGQSLLASDGDAGISLFEAGGGVHFIKNRMDAYKARLADLFHPSMRANSSALLNRALRDYQEAKDRQRKLQLRPASWLAERQAFEQEQQEIVRLQGELEQVSVALSKAQRLQRTLPIFQERALLVEKMADVVNTPVLLEVDEEAIEHLVQERRRLERELIEEDRLLDEEQSKLASLPKAELILNYQAEIEALRENFAVYQSAQSEARDFTSSLDQQKRDISHSLNQLRPNESIEMASLIVIPHGEKAELQELYQNFLDVRSEREMAARDKRNWETEYQDKLKVLSELPDVPETSVIRSRMQVWHSQGFTSDKQRELEVQLTHQKKSIDDTLRRQSYFQGDVEAFAICPIPLQETIQSYVELFRGLEGTTADLSRDFVRLAEEEARLNDELDQVDAAGELPDEQQLQQARQNRDEGWGHIRQQIEEPGIVTLASSAYASQAGSLVESYEQAVRTADNTVDLLRHEAERVARKGEIQKALSRVAQEVAVLNRRKVELDEQRDNSLGDWASIWKEAGITPGSPTEMHAWVQQFVQPVLREYKDWVSISQKYDVLTAALSEGETELRAWAQANQVDIPKHVQTFDQLIAYIEGHLRELEQQKNAKDNAKVSLAEVERKRETAQNRLDNEAKKMDELRQAYEQIRSQIPFLPEQVEHALSYVQAYDQLIEMVRHFQSDEFRFVQKSETIYQFEQQVIKVGTNVGIIESDGHVRIDSVYHELQQRLNLAKAAQETYINQAKLVEQQLKRCEKVKNLHAQFERDVDSWLSKLGVEVEDALMEVVLQSRNKRQLVQRMEQLESMLLSTGDGHALETLFAELEEVQDVDALVSTVEQHRQQVRRLEEEIGRRQVAFGERKQKFESMDGTNDDAALAMQQAAFFSEQVQAYWEELMQVQTNLTLLEEALAVFRDENQNGVIERAGRFFEQMTLGRYKGFDLDDHPDTPKLLAIGHKGGQRALSELSDGTVDQVHFALRLAFLQTQAESGMRLPLVMDDVFVHFDDERTAATLELLDELAGQMQIIYFTHHQHLIERVLPNVRSKHIKAHHLAESIVYRSRA